MKIYCNECGKRVHAQKPNKRFCSDYCGKEFNRKIDTKHKRMKFRERVKK